MNDWDLKAFFIVVFSIQLSILGLICLDYIGLQVPIIRQLVGLIYLCFLPGILVLRVFKIHGLGNSKTVIYAIGLSLSILMFTGFFMNIIYPLLGITKPLSLLYFVPTIGLIVLLLCFLCYETDRDYKNTSYIFVNEIFSSKSLFLYLIPFITVFGAYLVNFYQTNILLLLMILLISLVFLSIFYTRIIPENLYPLAIWIISISLVYHSSLISMYIRIEDIFMEYHFATLTLTNSFWNMALFANYNSNLSITILPSILCQFCNMSLTWVFKIIYPFLYSFVPLGLYVIFKEAVSNKIAFLSCFLFMAVDPFYTLVPFLEKQLVCEIFLISFYMIILTENFNKLKRTILLIIFSFSLIISHYGTSYLVMFSIIFCSIFQNILKHDSLFDFLHITKRQYGLEKNINNSSNQLISTNYILVVITFLTAWYMYISKSSLFYTLWNISARIFATLTTDYLNPDSSRGAYTLSHELPSTLYIAFRYIHIIIQIFITIGLFDLLSNIKNSKFKKEYIAFSFYWLLVLVSAIVIAGFASMNPKRLYHLGLFLLSPLFIIGCQFTLKKIYMFINISWTDKHEKYLLNIAAVFLVVFFLFSSGFIFEVAHDRPYSISLSYNSPYNYEDLKYKSALYTKIIPIYDVFSAEWLSIHMNNDNYVYSTLGYGEGLAALYSYGNITTIRTLDLNTKKVENGSYIYLMYVNIIKNVGFSGNYLLGACSPFNFSDVEPIIRDKSKIYNNGGSHILL